MRPVRLGVVGCGWWSIAHHLPAIVANPDAQLVGAADTDERRRQLVHDTFGTDTFRDVAQLLAEVEIDGLVVATPNATHASIATAAVERHKSVLIEKPMALTGRDARALITVADEHHASIVVGYPFQMTGPARKLRSLIRSGRLGDLQLIVASYTSSASRLFLDRPDGDGPDPASYQAEAAGGGQAYTQVTHLLGSILWTSGSRARRVMASMEFGGGEPLDTVDAIIVELEESGRVVISSIGTVRRGAPRQQYVWYYGSLGHAHHDLLLGAVDVHLDDSEFRYELDDGETPYPAHLPVDVLVGLLSGTTIDNLGPPEEAARTVEVLEAAYRAARTGLPMLVPCAA